MKRFISQQNLGMLEEIKKIYGLHATSDGLDKWDLCAIKYNKDT